MSILVKEDYVNPDIPLWAKNGSGGGGGVIPQLLNSMTTENYYNFENYDNTYITPLGASINQPVSGNVMVYVNMNIDGNGDNNGYAIPIIIEVNGNIYYTSEDYAKASSYTPTSYSFNISIPYVQGDTDEYYYRFFVSSSTDVRVKTSCSMVFYPNPV